MKTFLAVLFCKFYGRLRDGFSAMGVLCVLISMNIISILGYCKMLVEHTSHMLFPKIFELTIALSIALILYFLFLKDKKYEAIYEEFQQSKYSGRLGTKITFAYITFTVLVLAGLMPLAWSYFH